MDSTALVTAIFGAALGAVVAYCVITRRWWKAAVCQTAVVAYHEAFWIVTGTAAPVIALAAILSVGESATVGRNLGRFIWNAERHPDRYRAKNEDDTAWDQRLGTAHTARTYSMLNYWAAELNLATQAALLAMSAYQRRRR